MMVRRSFAVVITALVLAVVSTGVANARDVTVRDARHDVWRTNPKAKAPGVRNGDVVWTLFRHGPRNVVVQTKYVDLARIGSYAQYTLRIENGAHTYREVLVETSPNTWKGKARVFDRRGDRVRCRTRHQISYRANTIRIEVPRRCLNRPTYVRGTAASYWASKGGNIYTDNPHNKRSTVRIWTRWLRVD
jgi:hypothetical protein